MDKRQHWITQYKMTKAFIKYISFLVFLFCIQNTFFSEINSSCELEFKNLFNFDSTKSINVYIKIIYYYFFLFCFFLLNSIIYLMLTDKNDYNQREKILWKHYHIFSLLFFNWTPYFFLIVNSTKSYEQLYSKS